jgi:hypothetical protein
VSFDHEPGVSLKGLDRLPGDHWRPVNIGVKTDEYFKVFFPKKPDSWVFYYDGIPKRFFF